MTALLFVSALGLTLFFLSLAVYTVKHYVWLFLHKKEQGKALQEALKEYESSRSWNK